MKLINSGYKVVTVITTKGRKEKEYRIEQVNKLSEVMEIMLLKFPNFEMDTISLDNTTKEIEELLDIYKPEMIMTPHCGDLNRDHQITYQAVLTAVRPFPGKETIELFCIETVSSSE